MLFWGCEVNLRESALSTDRFFKFDLLKDHKHDYKQLKTAFPNEKFKQVVQQVLRNNYAAAKDSPESKQFNHFRWICATFFSSCASKNISNSLNFFIIINTYVTACCLGAHRIPVIAYRLHSAWAC